MHYFQTVYPITYYNNSTSITAFYCWDSDDDSQTVVALYQVIIMFILPAIFMIICYIFVIKELWISTKTIEQLTGNNIAMNSMTKESGTLLSDPARKRRYSPGLRTDNNGGPTFVTNCDAIEEDANLDAMDTDANYADANLDAQDRDADLDATLDANIDKNANQERNTDANSGDAYKMAPNKFKGQQKKKKIRSASKDSLTYSCSSLFTNG